MTLGGKFRESSHAQAQESVLRVVTLGSKTGRYGGPFTTAGNQVQTLKNYGIDATLLHGVIAGDEPIETANARVLTARVHRIVPGPEFPPLFSFGMLRKMFRGVRKASIVHVSLGRELIPTTAALMAIGMRRKLIIQTHGMIQRDLRLHARIVDSLVMRRIVRKADLVIVLTGVEAREIGEWLRGPLPISLTLGNGVNAADLPDYSPRPIPDSEILFMARFHRRKGVLDFAEAARCSARTESDAHYVAVGPDGGELMILRRAAAASGALEVQQAVAPNEIANRLVSARVFVQCSLNEPWGNVLVTALSLGIPCIVTRSAALSQLVNEYGAGIVVPDGSPLELANAVDMILGDSERWNRMSAGALRLSRDHFDLKRMGAQLVEAYRALFED